MKCQKAGKYCVFFFTNFREQEIFTGKPLYSGIYVLKGTLLFTFLIIMEYLLHM